MSIITSMRRQDAIYWPPTVANDFGRPDVSAAVDLIVTVNGNFRVRWEDVVEEFLDASGTTTSSRARVYVPLLPDGTEVAVGGWLWLGLRVALGDVAVPQENKAAYEVRRFDKLPTLKASEFLRTAML